MEIVTYSRNIFIPLTNACRNKCAYCGFRSSNPTLLEPSEVDALLLRVNNASEALFTFGERPEVFPQISEKLKRIGYKDFISYIIDMNQLAISRGLLPHTNAGILSKEEIKKLKPYNASMGLMLEQAVELKCHENSPGKKPEKRIKMIKEVGKLSIPFTTGLLVGIGETHYDRIYSLEVINELHKNYGHIQEVIIQNFQPKKGTEMEKCKPPSTEEMLETVKNARDILNSEISIQIPPNLVKDIYPFLKAGARDLGGISDFTDYINPEHPFPSVKEIEKQLGNEFVLRERLPIYPDYIKRGWFSEALSKLINRLSDQGGFRCYS
ncbi:MAG TPA: 7,8-didemethyl-8-hydroxy-5-deazariboflavin synthase subunit CofG [Archaeoglobaceae archaeon]|nr:7,8-didemethyl-8-hydroxy-5-deazariboflavin synthase subunit CofG [Archaeoglobaceae archaeon]